MLARSLSSLSSLHKVASGLTDGQCKLLTFAATTSTKNAAKEPGGLLGLTPDMAAAIHAYTQESKFYKKLNVLLRSRARAQLKPFFPYLKLFMSAMHRLPPEKCTLYVMHSLCEHAHAVGVYTASVRCLPLSCNVSLFLARA